MKGKQKGREEDVG